MNDEEGVGRSSLTRFLRSSFIFHRSAFIGLLLFSFAHSLAATTIESVSTRGRNVVKQYQLDGRPAGIAVGADGLLYVGMANDQSVIAIDTAKDAIVREVVLDDPDIAATKELRTLRLDRRLNRLIIAQGTDESVSILTLPELAIEREITLEGELIRDAVPDPLGRYLFVLGRDLHIFDASGDRVIRTIREIAPMAIAVSDDGSTLAVVGSEEFSAGKATVVSLWDLAELRESSREPLQTDRDIRAVTFAASGRALIAVADDWLGEKSLGARSDEATMKKDSTGNQRMEVSFGDLVSSETICLSGSAGAQSLVTNADGTIVYFPEKRCGSSGTFTGSKRLVVSASVYGVDAAAVEREKRSGRLWVSDPEGTVTLYETPTPARR